MAPPARTRLLVVLLFLAATGSLTAQDELPMGRDPLLADAPDHLSYWIDCALLDDRVIRGTVEVRWRNTLATPTSELWWHVYQNAFRDRGSVFLTEAHRLQHRDGGLPEAFGGSEILSVRLLRLGRIDFESRPELPWEWVPDPAAAKDQTVLRVDLPGPVEEGRAVEVAIEFQAHMIPAWRRNGWGHDFLHAAQWYPKLGVYEATDQGARWNCPPYHLLTEFYADFADYVVRLTLPEAYHGNVVATGEQRSEAEELPDGHTRHTFHADAVHDFAWSVDGDAQILERDWREEDWRDGAEERKVAAALDLPVAEVRPDRPVRMVLMLQPEDAAYAERYFTAMGRALYYFGLWYGPYPYPTITCVDPSNDAMRVGGMEYPRLFTAGVRRGRHPRALSPEAVTVHEFGHQYWYGLVASNEFEHAWMDEGFCSFSTARVLGKGWQAPLATYEVLGRQRAGRAPLRWPAAARGAQRSMLSLARLELPAWAGFPQRSVAVWRQGDLVRYLAEMPAVSYFPTVQGDPILDQRRVFGSDWAQPMSTPSWQLLAEDQRGVNTYRRPALTLETMARLMGEERWIRLMRSWFQQQRFRHPQPSAWQAALLEHARGARIGADLPGGGLPIDWPHFWQQAYEGNQIVDFGVHRVVNLPRADDADHWDVHIELRRYGDFELPVVIEASFDDGSVERWVWDGRTPVHTKRILASTRRVLQVVIDPDRQLLLDRNGLNNSWTANLQQERVTEIGWRTLLWAQSVLHFFGGVG